MMTESFIGNQQHRLQILAILAMTQTIAFLQTGNSFKQL